MKKTLHIVSVAGYMIECFEKYGISDDIITFDGAFRYLPLFNHTNEESLNKRSQALTKLYRDDYNFGQRILDFANYDFNKYGKVVVWHGDDVDERILLYFTCSLVNVDLYDVDVTYIKPYMSNKNIIHVPLYCCSIENIRRLYDRINPIPKEKQLEYASIWGKWSKSDAPLRILNKDDTIIEVSEDHFDKFIISHCSDEYVTASLNIAKTLLDCDFAAGESYLLHRIIHLIKEGILSVRAIPKESIRIEESNQNDSNRITVNGVNVTQRHFFEIKLNA